MRRRPTYTDEIADEICAKLKEGRSLISICQAAHMPAESTVRQWAVDDYEGFAAKYARARDVGLDHVADDVLAIADSDLDPNDKRIRFDARRWYLSKIAPKRYGDKLDVSVNGEVHYVFVGEKEQTAEEWSQSQSD